MARNFDPNRRPGRDWFSNERFNQMRRSLYRSANGKVLGVFQGIAESRGYAICKTRAIGVVALVLLAVFMGAHELKVIVLVAGFFYLLAALLMQPPRQSAATADPVSPVRRSMPPPIPPRNDPAVNRPRVDLAQLDRQLDGLNRRIQRMEAIVTDREYDWNRRMES